MGFFFFSTGKGSVYVACGNRMGGNELRFPRVGKREVNPGATPPTSCTTLGVKKKSRAGFLMYVRGVGVWYWGRCVCARGSSRSSGVRVCARAAVLVVLEVVGVLRGAPLALGLSVGAGVCPEQGRALMDARCVRNVLYFSMSLKIVLMKRKISQGNHNQ